MRSGFRKARSQTGLFRRFGGPETPSEAKEERRKDGKMKSAEPAHGLPHRFRDFGKLGKQENVLKFTRFQWKTNVAH